MFPMTPLQSWALLILGLGSIVMILWACAGRTADAVRAEADPGRCDSTADERPLAEVIPIRRRSVRSAGEQPEQQSKTTEPYDWAVRGI